MQRRTFIWAVLSLMLGVLCLTPAVARADEKGDLQENFKRRYPELLAAKDAGEIGETWKGFVAAVNGITLSDKVKSLIDNENSDRRRLYDILAKETGATPELVAERNATRNFRQAKSGHWLLGKDDKWFQKP